MNYKTAATNKMLTQSSHFEFVSGYLAALIIILIGLLALGGTMFTVITKPGIPIGETLPILILGIALSLIGIKSAQVASKIR
jgi:hypothetical membrane protein